MVFKGEARGHPRVGGLNGRPGVREPEGAPKGEQHLLSMVFSGEAWGHPGVGIAFGGLAPSPPPLAVHGLQS